MLVTVSYGQVGLLDNLKVFTYDHTRVTRLSNCALAVVTQTSSSISSSQILCILRTRKVGTTLKESHITLIVVELRRDWVLSPRKPYSSAVISPTIPEH